MKKLVLYGVVGALAVLLTNSPIGVQAMDDGIINSGGDHGYHMGPGMTPDSGSRDYGTGPCRPVQSFENEPHYPKDQLLLDRKDAKRILEDYLGATPGSKLKLGDIKDQGTAFEADLRTTDNFLVNQLFVDKDTCQVRSAH